MDRGMAVIFSLEMIFDPYQLGIHMKCVIFAAVFTLLSVVVDQYLNSELLNESIGTKILPADKESVVSMAGMIFCISSLGNRMGI